MSYKDREPQIKLFLESIANLGTTTEAVEASGLPGSTVYRWRSENEDFADRWKEAFEAGTDKIEAAYKSLALGSKTEKPNEKALWNLLKSRRPEVYGDKVEYTSDNKIDVVYHKDWGNTKK